MGSRKNNTVLSAVLIVMIAGCQPAEDKRAQVPAAKAELAATVSSVPSVFAAEDFLGEATDVLVIPNLETEETVGLRARTSGLDPKTVAPRAYGFKVYQAWWDSETGSSFLSRLNVYQWGTKGKIFIDKHFYYGDGFTAQDVAAVSEKYWSCQHMLTDGEMAQLLTLAEAVRTGTGHQQAFEATQIGGFLSKACDQDQPNHEKSGNWILGPQKIEEDVFVELSRLKGVGNRFTTKFIPSP